MPKAPAGVTKTTRLDAVQFVLNQWGRLNKTQIDLRVAEHLKVTPDEI